MTASTKLTGLTHYAPYPHTPEASYEHGIATGVNDDDMTYEYGVCRTCRQPFSTHIPYVANEPNWARGNRVGRLAVEQAHEEALEDEAQRIADRIVYGRKATENTTGRTLATLTGAAKVTARRDGSTYVEFSTAHYTFRLIHDTAWAGSKAAERRTRLYSPAITMDDMQQPPATRKGTDPENDKAWAAYRRTEISRQRAVIGDAVAELNAEAGSAFGWTLPVDLAAAKLSFSQKAGCACNCSPGYIVQASFPGPLRDGYKSVSDILISRKGD